MPVRSCCRPTCWQSLSMFGTVTRSATIASRSPALRLIRRAARKPMAWVTFPFRCSARAAALSRIAAASAWRRTRSGTTLSAPSSRVWTATGSCRRRRPPWRVWSAVSRCTRSIPPPPLDQAAEPRARHATTLRRHARWPAIMWAYLNSSAGSGSGVVASSLSRWRRVAHLWTAASARKNWRPFYPACHCASSALSTTPA
mmetsp:Transcript_101828/g.287254  ORF Transcript_101828/g.287254 Transcript_101828/m.287254 type:complete len:200 (+) Transcript_101828:249-848(+)